MKKLDEASSKDFASHMAAESTKLFIQKAKASTDDSAVFSTIISSDDEDRQGESVSQEGLDFTNYMKNPVVLWGHDYYSLPIGICLGVEKSGNQTIAKFKFAPAEANPFASQCQKLWEMGIQRAVSIGFIPRSFDDAGNTLTAEVLEFSLVPIPANPVALNTDMVKQNHLDLAMLVAKGVAFKFETTPIIDTSKPSNQKTMKERIADLVAKGAEPGASCSLDDGTPGVLSRDPGNPDGPLICTPVENASAKGKEKPENDGDEDESTSNQQAQDLQRSLEQTLEREGDTHSAKTDKAIGTFQKSIQEWHDSSDDEPDEKSAMPKEAEECMKSMHDATDAEHDRHGEKVDKAIDEYTKGIQQWSSSADDEPDEKAAKPKAGESDEDDEDEGSGKPSTPTEIVKATGALKSDIADEHDLHRKSMHKMIDQYGKKMVGTADQDVRDKHGKAMQSDASDEMHRHEKALNDAVAEFHTSVQAKGEKGMQPSKKMSKSAKKSIEEAKGHMQKAMDAHEDAMDAHMEAKKHLKAAHAALGNVDTSRANSEDEDSGSDEKPDAVPSKTQRSSSSKGSDDDLNEFIRLRKLTRDVSTTINESIKNLNKTIEDRKSQSQ
jgi:exonuclease VII small subunit